MRVFRPVCTPPQVQPGSSPSSYNQGYPYGGQPYGLGPVPNVGPAAVDMSDEQYMAQYTSSISYSPGWVGLLL